MPKVVAAIIWYAGNGRFSDRLLDFLFFSLAIYSIAKLILAIFCRRPSV